MRNYSSCLTQNNQIAKISVAPAGFFKNSYFKITLFTTKIKMNIALQTQSYVKLLVVLLSRIKTRLSKDVFPIA